MAGGELLDCWGFWVSMTFPGEAAESVTPLLENLPLLSEVSGDSYCP